MTTHARRALARSPGVQPAQQAALAVQHGAGNRALGRTLARKATAVTSTVQIGKLKIPVSGGNLADWKGSDVPDELTVSSEKGKHSKELARLAGDPAKIPSLTLTLPLTGGQGEELNLGSLAIELNNARFVSYDVDGTTETWTLKGYDGVHRTKTSHKVA